MSLVFATRVFFLGFFLGGGGLRHSAVQTDFEFEISGSLTHNIGFYEELTKISLNYHKISSNTHLIMSPPEGLGDILFFPRRPSVYLSAETDVYLCVLNHGRTSVCLSRIVSAL